MDEYKPLEQRLQGFDFRAARMLRLIEAQIANMRSLQGLDADFVKDELENDEMVFPGIYRLPFAVGKGNHFHRMYIAITRRDVGFAAFDEYPEWRAATDTVLKAATRDQKDADLFAQIMDMVPPAPEVVMDMIEECRLYDANKDRVHEMMSLIIRKAEELNTLRVKLAEESGAELPEPNKGYPGAPSHLHTHRDIREEQKEMSALCHWLPIAFEEARTSMRDYLVTEAVASMYDDDEPCPTNRHKRCRR